MKEPERILVVPTEVFRRLGIFQGFTRNFAHYLPTLLEPGNLRYISRPLAETDSTLKQLIPYVVLRHGDRVFHYTRGKAGGESRLHALRSLGVGGHICETDGDLSANAYEAGMRRELEEEIDLQSPFQERIIGLINDDATPVGQVHLGIVHLFDLQQERVRRRESSLTDAGFAPLADLRRNASAFETWSQFLLAEGVLD